MRYLSEKQGGEHTAAELIARAEAALTNPQLLRIVQTAESANAAQKTARMQGRKEEEVYACWAATRLLFGYGGTIPGPLDTIPIWALSGFRALCNGRLQVDKKKLLAAISVHYSN